MENCENFRSFSYIYIYRLIGKKRKKEKKKEPVSLEKKKEKKIVLVGS